MKTTAEMYAAGYERIKCRSQRRHLATLADGRKITLNDGADGWGQADRIGIAVSLRGIDGRIERSIPLAEIVVEAIADVRDGLGRGGALCDFARTAEIDAAVSELSA